MSNVSDKLFIAAASLALIGVLAHEIVGAPIVLAPLSQSDLPNEVIWLHHFSWHVASVAALAIVALLLLAARRPDGFIFAAVATAMSVGFAAIGILLAVFGDHALWRTPAPYPWTVVAILGAAGLWLEIQSK